VILPLAAALLIAVHMWRIRKDGGLYVRQSQPGVESPRESHADEAGVVKV
jgi:hypothetical protein